MECRAMETGVGVDAPVPLLNTLSRQEHLILSSHKTDAGRETTGSSEGRESYTFAAMRPTSNKTVPLNRQIL
ncbi:hypothetical protein E2C01_067574 [Portunus trituberculatus]|uniref:Uncharacterized protein n=1 Tax=Portunus trituberculatus TaxID=210409 RepID=A0A5B7HPP3_PORTR|nr:hypothetical protein [Portunus trituberculatus]